MAPKPPRTSRIRRADGNGTLTRVGLSGPQWGDLYHSLLRTSWWWFLALVCTGYLLANAFFAAIYFAVGGIENMRSGSFAEAFFFSVQTLGTIGYGRMVPLTLAANLAVTAESLAGMLGVALITGLIFAKFARPNARVLWSKVLVLQLREGQPHVVFRMANERSNQIVEATFRLTVLMDEVTTDGERLRRLHDLPLVRSNTPSFNLSVTAMHRITADSPLHGKLPEDLARVNAQFFCSLTGMDDTFSQTVHTRQIYRHTDLRWNQRFVDILSSVRPGDATIDYTRFHDVEPEPPRLRA